MKPNITIYSTGTAEQTKKFEGYITAAFWIGVDHTEGEVGSVKVRQPTESYDTEVETLTEFVGLMVQRQINFSVEFFTEPVQHAQRVPMPSEEVEMSLATESPLASEVVTNGDLDFEQELMKVKDEYKSGRISKKQYESKKGGLLNRWRERIEGKLER